MGLPQFIPSSFRSYAVDFDGDGRRDLWSNTGDAIGSVAHYFNEHGWQAGKAVVSRADTPPAPTTFTLNPTAAAPAAAAMAPTVPKPTYKRP